MASELGTSINYVSVLERGLRYPSLELAIAIEKLAGLPVETWPNLECVAELIARRLTEAQREAA